MSKKVELSLDTLAAIVDNMRDELLVVDREYRIVYVNNVCRRHYGKTKEELIGTRIWFGVKANDPTKTLAPAVFSHKRPMEHRQHTYTGARVFTSAVPFFDAQGEVIYVIMNVRDEWPMTQDGPVFACGQTAPRDDGNIVFCSRAMEKVLKLADQVAQVPSACLLLGETGTGKSRLARYLHDKGPRADSPFVTINCAGIPQDLMESELYGHKKGAFAGAISDKKGLFEVAKGGTLFLDEISELPFAMQGKLLHTLQEKEFRRVGDTRTLKTDVKVVAATNRDMAQLIRNKGFRSDLYYRLNVFEITIPPLRRRPDDIIPLFLHFQNLYCKEYGIEKSVDHGAMEILSNYEWPGNIRELSHTVERLMVTCTEPVINPGNLPSFLHQAGPTQDRPIGDQGLDAAVESVERDMVLAAQRARGTVREVAAALKISPTRAFRLMKKYGAPQEDATGEAEEE